MATQQRQGGVLQRAGTLSMLIYYTAVRNVRKSHRSPVMAILTNMLQTVIFVLAFYVMSALLGLRGSSLRGDFLIYIMSGIFLYLTHIKAMGAVAGSEGPASPMMQHAPMTTFVAIASAALGALYVQVLSLFVILFAYHVAWTPLNIEQPIATFGMLLIAWFTGCALGMVVRSILTLILASIAAAASQILKSFT